MIDEYEEPNEQNDYIQIGFTGNNKNTQIESDSKYA